MSAVDTYDSARFSRLEDMFVLSHKVLESNSEQRSQRVSVRAILSDVISLLSGVSQSSVPGPSAFTVYAYPLGIVTQPYGVTYLLSHTAVYIT